MRRSAGPERGEVRGLGRFPRCAWWVWPSAGPMPWWTWGGGPCRVIVYTIDDPGRPQAESQYRLLTTILDPEAGPAAELACLYDQRWEFESTLDELKTHQRGARVVLRSKLPGGAVQELYGMLCVHYAIRWLMHAVALDVDADPDRLSFIRTLRVARRTTASHPGFSPSDS